jgi:hypothetical protein
MLQQCQQYNICDMSTYWISLVFVFILQLSRPASGTA